jgi:TorA maturation chaperone TorD
MVGDNNLKPKSVKKKNGIPTAKNINNPKDHIG